MSISLALSQAKHHQSCKTTDTGLMHHLVCPFTPQLLLVSSTDSWRDIMLIWHWYTIATGEIWTSNLMITSQSHRHGQQYCLQSINQSISQSIKVLESRRTKTVINVVIVVYDVRPISDMQQSWATLLHWFYCQSICGVCGVKRCSSGRQRVQTSWSLKIWSCDLSIGVHWRLSQLRLDRREKWRSSKVKLINCGLTQQSVLQWWCWMVPDMAHPVLSSTSTPRRTVCHLPSDRFWNVFSVSQNNHPLRPAVFWHFSQTVESFKSVF